MTVAELLNPRVRVVAGWPDMSKRIEVGQVLGYKKDFGGGYCNLFSDWLPATDVERFPHLFEPIEWWEGRDVKDMPKYVKYDDKVYKVLPPEFDYRDYGHNDTELEYRSLMHKLEYWKLKMLPATQSDYEAYIKTQSK